MRTGELLNALTQNEAGVVCDMTPNHALVITQYPPGLIGEGDTLFEAALLVAAELFLHPDCPPEVKTALEEYDHRTKIMSL